MDKNKKRIIVYIIVFCIAFTITCVNELYNFNTISVIVKLISGSASLAAVIFALYGLIESYTESKSKKICYISNNTTFSNRIYDGIIYSKLNVSYFISRKIIGSDINELIKFMQDDAYRYRGLMIRYKFKNTDEYAQRNAEFAELVNKYLKEKDNSIVFVDTEVEFLNIKEQGWSIVNSNLTKGGTLVAKEIEKICKLHKNPYVLIIDGPGDDPNVNRRLKTIKEYEFIENKKNLRKIHVDRLKKDIVFDAFVSAINDNESDFLINPDSMIKEKIDALILFCGNDQLLYDFMRTLNLRHPSNPTTKIIKDYFNKVCANDYSNLYLIGYDGLKDIDFPISEGKDDYAYKLEVFKDEFKYFSIDAKPYEQGRQSIETLDSLINNNFMHGKKIEEIEPVSYQSNLWPTYAYVFDLDGTLANTEQLHLDTYNEVLKPFNVTISIDEFCGYIGRTEETIHEEIKEKHNINYDTEKMTNERLEAYKKLINKSDSLFVPEPLLKIINDRSCKKYILSSQKKDIIDLVLNKLNIQNSFDKIISCKNQNYSKTYVLDNPTTFFNTSNIVVCEDSVSILHHAKELGYQTIGVIHPINKNTFNSNDCDIVIKDFINI